MSRTAQIASRLVRASLPEPKIPTTLAFLRAKARLAMPVVAPTRIADMLVLWENIDVQLAYRPVGGSVSGHQQGTVLRRVNARVA